MPECRLGRGILIALAAMLAMAGIVRAQEGLGQRMSVERIGDIDTGAYTASNGTGFVPKADTVIEAGDEVLLVLDPGLEEAITAYFAPNGLEMRG